MKKLFFFFLQIFTGVFTAEALLKLIAMTPVNYFKNKWNTFDIVIVIISLTELFISSKKMSVMRSFRLVIELFKIIYE
jgi:hypothetical protein